MQKIRERAAVLIKPGRTRRVLGDKDLRRAFEKFLSDKLLHHREAKAQRPGQSKKKCIAIDVEPVG